VVDELREEDEQEAGDRIRNFLVVAQTTQLQGDLWNKT
jgi:hypothetical protein